MATERSFSSHFWTSSFTSKWSPEEKLVYIFLRTNDHLTLCGLYQITIDVISMTLKLPQEVVKSALDKLEEADILVYDEELVFIKNFPEQQNSGRLPFITTHVQKINKYMVKHYPSYHKQSKAYQAFYEVFKDKIEAPPVLRKKKKGDDQRKGDDQKKADDQITGKDQYHKDQCHKDELTNETKLNNLYAEPQEPTQRLPVAYSEPTRSKQVSINSDSNSDSNSNLDSDSYSNSDLNAFKGAEQKSKSAPGAQIITPSYQEVNPTISTDLSTVQMSLDSSIEIRQEVKEKMKHSLKEWEAEQLEQEQNSSRKLHTFGNLPPQFPVTTDPSPSYH